MSGNEASAIGLLRAIHQERLTVTLTGTGTRYFGSDVRGTIFQSTSAAFTAAPGSTATPVQ
jgi:hypothetical protein